MKKFNLRKKILALTLTAITMFSTVTGILPGGVVHAADATSGTYYGIDWDMDADGNLTLEGGTCTYTKGTKWSSADVKTVKCEGNIVCNDNFCKELFYYHENLVSADVSGFDTSNVTKMKDMFHNCTGLTSLDLSSFDISTVTSATMLTGCNGLEVLTTPKTVGTIDINLPLTMCDDNGNQYTLLNSSNTNMTLYLCINGSCYGVPYTYYKNTETVVLHEGVATKTSGNYRFPITTKVVKTDGHVVMNNAFCAYGPFSYIPNAEIIDLSNVDTSNVTNMTGMFNGCKKIAILKYIKF